MTCSAHSAYKPSEVSIVLQTIDLTKRFGDTLAVDQLNLHVEKGDLVGLLGPNGAGKSTTISMIATLLIPDSGKVLYKEQDIVRHPEVIRSGLGFVPQNLALYNDLSGRDNLKFWGRLYGLRGDELKRRIEDVSEIIGISDRLKDKVKDYSGGMKRRLNIGAALLHKPEFLIMDEPTVGIDPQSRNHILSAVRALNREGMTILYTSHYMEEVEELCRMIYIMDLGKLIASGTQTQLVALAGGGEEVTARFETVSEALVERLKGLRGLKGLKGLEKTVQEPGAETMVVLNFEGDGGHLKPIIELAGELGHPLVSVDVRKPNLESVFLKLTGKALRD
jgi:ABC-2 type transport system ATP-binding protein